MTWAKRKKAVVICVVVLMLVALVFVLTKKSSSSVKDIYFVLDPRTPPNLVIIRPAHFVMPDARGNYWHDFINNGKVSTYMSGRGVTLKGIISAAYGFDEPRIVFPPDFPAELFDFLVTVPDKEKEELQAAIKSKFGYIAHEEKRDTDVLALKVESPDLPGMQISTNNARSYRAGKLTHFRVGVVIWSLQNRLQQPIVDETGLTNFYDFNWNFGVRDKPTIDKHLASLGLGLEPKTKSLNVLVVEKAY
jgi:uncharacterized protein (TIGR03435 family)